MKRALGWKRLFPSLAGALACLLAGAPRAGSDEQTAAKLHRVEQRRRLVSELAREGYFRDASCREISNFLLEHAGLPQLKKNGAVSAGERLNTDRRGENQDPPEFADGVAYRDRARSTFRLTGAGDRHEWQMTLRREMVLPDRDLRPRHLRIDTRYRFAVVEKHNIGSCELADIVFRAHEEGVAQDFTRTFSADECLDLFLRGNPTPETAPATVTATFGQLRTSCALGMRYSGSTKNAVSTTAF